MNPLEIELFSAINTGNVTKVENLINKKVNVNARDYKLFTALHAAVSLLSHDVDNQKRYANIINKLLNAGADPILLLDSNGFNVMQQAIYRGSELYHDNKVREANFYFELSEELLHRLHRHPNFMQSLDQQLSVKQGKLIGVPHTLLHMVAYFGWARMVRKLVEYGSDVGLLNGSGLTALHLVVLMYAHSKKSEYIKITTSLLFYQASLAPQLINQPWTGIWYAQFDKLLSTVQIQGAGDTPLHTAVKYKLIPLILVLLKYNADTSIFNSSKKTAEQIARENNDREIVGLFDDARLDQMIVSRPSNIYLFDPFRSTVKNSHLNFNDPADALEEVIKLKRIALTQSPEVFVEKSESQLNDDDNSTAFESRNHVATFSKAM